MKRAICLILSLMMLCISLPALGEDTERTIAAQVISALRKPVELDALHARMTADMQSALPVEALSGLWAQLEAAGGQCKAGKQCL